MRIGFRVVGAFILLVCGSAFVFAQTQPSSPSDGVEITQGFKLRPNGVIDIGDLFTEVNYYDDKWTIAQQHDRFTPVAPATQPAAGPAAAPAAAATSHSISGVLTTAGGPANYSEQVDVVDGGINYSATLNSDKELATNEVSMAFLLPTSSFAGKQITIDQQPLVLSADPAKKGEPRLSEKDDASQVELPTSVGTLTISGNFHFLIQDDREWGDPRYSMRLYFKPGSGQIKQSKIDLQFRLKPAHN